MMKKHHIAAKQGLAAEQELHSDRQWPLPSRPFAMRMTWEDLLFVHWPMDPQEIQRHLPTGLKVDTWKGSAWIAVVPFRMSDVAPRGIPAVPGVSAFPELNVRTYVTTEDKPGVWFFSLDATSWLAVRLARWAFHLPYMDAKITSRFDGTWYHYDSQRVHRNERSAHFRGRYRPTGQVFYAEPGSLEFWLTARYCLYAADPRGRVYRGEIDHGPWPLQNAEFRMEANNLLDGWEGDFAGSPHLLFSQSIAVRAWTNQRVA